MEGTCNEGAFLPDTKNKLLEVAMILLGKRNMKISVRKYFSEFREKILFVVTRQLSKATALGGLRSHRSRQLSLRSHLL